MDATQQQLLDLLEQAFEKATQLEGKHHAARPIKILLQQATANLNTDTALKMRGQIATGGGPVQSAAIIQTGEGKRRFGTTPPPQEVFINPNMKAADAPPAATDKANGGGDNSGVEEIYAKILKLTPQQVVSTYGESGVVGMIKVLGGSISSERKPAQKAAYLKSLIENRGKEQPVADDENTEETTA
jgi:hypothetical protein